MGKTTSTSRSGSGLPPAGTGSDAPPPSPSSACAPRGSSHRPSRPISIERTSYRSGSSASITERAEASEISCSLERPPMRTATRSGSTTFLLACELAHGDDHRTAGRRLRVSLRILVQDDVVEQWVVGLLLLHLHLEPGVLELLLGLIFRLAFHIGNRHALGSRRDGDLHDRV